MRPWRRCCCSRSCRSRQNWYELADPITLVCERVILVPLTHAHAVDLAEAVQDGEL